MCVKYVDNLKNAKCVQNLNDVMLFPSASNQEHEPTLVIGKYIFCIYGDLHLKLETDSTKHIVMFSVGCGLENKKY